MASNGTVIADEADENSDWIEIYNPGTSPINLNGFYITDDPSNPTKHKLTTGTSDLTIGANGFLLLWASGTPTLGSNHLNFALSASGEAVFLYASNGSTLVDSISFGQQKTNISYGRISDRNAQWGYFSESTPGASNNGKTVYQGFLAPPVFSQSAGFYSNPFSLSISSNPSDAVIYYSLDGTTPSSETFGGKEYSYKNQFPRTPSTSFGPMLKDTMHSYLYQQSIPISDKSNEPNHLAARSTTFGGSHPASHNPTVNIYKGTVVKARAFKSGFIPSDVATATYFFTADGSNPYDLPIISISTQEDYLFDYEDGIYTAGKDFDDWRTAFPNDDINDGRPANWFRGTEYPLSLEIIEANATRSATTVNAGFRLHGGFSRARPRKTLRLYFKSMYGSSTLGYPIFPSQTETEFKRILIRNSGQDESNTNLRDMVVQKVIEHMNFDTQDGYPYVIFINGEYWGISNARERYDTKYFLLKYGIPENEIDLLEFDSEVQEGSNQNYVDMMIYIGNNDVKNTNIYREIGKRMDVDNFIDFYISQIFVGNTDWPGNNVKYYRRQTTEYIPDAPYGNDGRWRWIVFDTDFAFGRYDDVDHNTLAMVLDSTSTAWPNPTWSTLLFRSLMKNAAFKKQFILRFSDMLNTGFLPQVSDSILSHFENLVASHMPDHTDRWRLRPNLSGWQANV